MFYSIEGGKLLNLDHIGAIYMRPTADFAGDPGNYDIVAVPTEKLYCLARQQPSPENENYVPPEQFEIPIGANLTKQEAISQLKVLVRVTVAEITGGKLPKKAVSSSLWLFSKIIRISHPISPLL